MKYVTTFIRNGANVGGIIVTTFIRKGANVGGISTGQLQYTVQKPLFFIC